MNQALFWKRLQNDKNLIHGHLFSISINLEEALRGRHHFCSLVMCTCACYLSFHKLSCLRYFGVIACWNTFSFQLNFDTVLDARESHLSFFACFRKPAFSKLLYVLGDWRALLGNRTRARASFPSHTQPMQSLAITLTHLFRWLVHFKNCLVATIQRI